MKHRHRWLIGVLVVVALAGLALIAPGEEGAIAAGGILYVDADAPAGGDGSSWTDAYADLQDALDAAGTGTQIWVVEGTYKPTSGTDRAVSFQMKDGVEIYGGFAGGEGSLGDRNWETNVTVLSGDIGTVGDNSDNSYHVFYHPSGLGLDDSAVLDGFTITGGYANGSWPHYDGGGMYNNGSSPTLINCTFSGNSAYGTDPMWPVGSGGGMYNTSGSSPMLTNCTFSGNSATSQGGGIYSSAGSTTLTACTFSGNWAMEGGAIFNQSGLKVLTNCTFSNNHADMGGGGIYNNGGQPTLTGCTFSGNAANSGGGMHNQNSSPTVENCAFTGNTAWDGGGGMYNIGGSSPTLTDCTFSSNSANDGGGVYNWSSSPMLKNCTFSDNLADFRGSGMYNYDDSGPVLTSCTFSGNSASDYGGGMYNEGSSPTLDNCAFEANSAGSNGGGMSNTSGSSPMLTNCTFETNSAGWYGGGMSNTSGSSPTLSDCAFVGNTAGVYGVGGGMYNGDSSPTLTDCAFTGNSAGNTGGGMSNASSSPKLTNCTFAGNSAVYVGGGMYNGDSSPILTNCTFSANTAPDGGGMYNGYNSAPVVINSILWGDSTGEISNYDDLFLSPQAVTYSDVQGGYEGDGNIDADPLFVDAGGGDFHLGPGSPCIDAGTNDAPYLPDLDFEGELRVVDGNGDGTAIVDMGVDEAYSEPPPPPPDVIFVDVDAVGTNTGMSWEDALLDLEDALAWAVDGVEIWVAEGTYKPTVQHGGTGDRYKSFQMKNGVAIYGGFDPTAGDDTWEERDWLTNVTILSGDIGAVGDSLDNSYHVFYHPSGTDLDNTAILDGFTITGGYASGTLPHSNGGGMYNDGSSPALTNCAFEDNFSYRGGGMFNTNGSSPVLSNCTIAGNYGDSGGGMHNLNSSPTLTNCTIAGNGAMSGGGMFNNASSPVLTNCTIANNSDWDSGGIYNYYSSPTLTNCILWGNSPNQIRDYNRTPELPYRDVQGGYAGTGNIDADPLFVDAASRDFHLGEGSPCIDAGSNDAPFLPAYDFEGDDRVLDGDGDEIAIVDMGVDEFVYVPPPPPVIFVDVDATGTNTGTSWTDAFTTLQPALSWAVAGVEIWVAEGVYKPTQLFIAGDARSASFQMKNGVAIYGGFAGTEESLDDRVWDANETVLSGDIGIEGDDEDNSYHVFYHPAGANLNSNAILDGFTVNGGNANGDYPNGYGGGMYNNGSSPTLANCTFSGNSAYGPGGGMYNYAYSSPTLTNCTFTGNSAGWGGGISNSYSSPTLTNCTFSSNSARDGGGMYNFYSSPVLTDCTFWSNTAEYDGGGMYNDISSSVLTDCTFSSNSARDGGGMYNTESSSPTLTNCTFYGNSALDSGGGMWNSTGSSPVLTDCAFSGNSADYGGGMNNDASSPVLTNCIFAGNSANQGNGGGMYNWDSSSPTLTNCTFYGNLAYADGGGVFNHFYSSAVLTNSILWENSPNQIANDASSPVVTYCDVMGDLYPGMGNINLDPLFVDAEGGDFHLGADSPCVDAGSNDAPFLPAYDFEGDDRVLDGDGDGDAIVDMGVDEVVYAGPTVVEIDVRPGSDQNVINLGSGGVLPVAILTTGDFDASTVRPASVRFAGAAPKRWTREDVDGDGDEDLLLNFKIQELVDLDESSTEATLRGETFPWDGGVLIEGTDTVRIIP